MSTKGKGYLLDIAAFCRITGHTAEKRKWLIDHLKY